MRQVVLASRNPGKVREFQHLLAPLDWEVLSQVGLGIPEAPEPHPTFVENALAKARHVARATGLPALADDSGLCVPALGGLPGVISAHFAGEPKSDARNNGKLVRALADLDDRRAHYTCVLAWLDSAEDPEPLIAEGRWHGELVLEPRGANGFGYDPYFYVPDMGCTAAEMTLEAKNAVSHRALAFQVLRQKLETRERSP